MALTPRGDEYEPWQSFAEETAPVRHNSMRKEVG